MSASTTAPIVDPRTPALLAWYDRHARVLPWRIGPAERAAGIAPDPYRIWLSEVMLQQTTVATVKGYFARFTERWRDVEALAAADQSAVLAEWAGLGYYSRARNLHACARAVVDDHAGRFPSTAAALKALPGIGDYTAAAIAAIAFNEPATVVDGNVERVVTRLFAIADPLPGAKPAVRARMAALTPAARPGDFAQAVMDLGATICTPRKPACVICPLRDDCRATAEGTAETFPVKAPKRAKPSRVGAAFVAFRARDGAVWLRRRAPTGMLGGMSEPPTTGWRAGADGATTPDAAPFRADWRHVGRVEHGFTHFGLTLEVYVAELAASPEGADGWWSAEADRASEALPTLMRKALARAAAAKAP